MSDETETKQMLDMGQTFVDLGKKLAANLAATGFAPAKAPPFVEPHFPSVLSELSLDEVKNLYDRFISFYDYLTDQITNLELYLKTTEERADTVAAAITLEAATRKELSNAELRKAFVQTHGAYLVARSDHLYTRQMHGAQDERRKKISKSMSRLGQEIFVRTSGRMGEPTREEREDLSNRNTERPKMMFRKVQDMPKVTHD